MIKRNSILKNVNGNEYKVIFAVGNNAILKPCFNCYDSYIIASGIKKFKDGIEWLYGSYYPIDYAIKKVYIDFKKKYL